MKTLNLLLAILFLTSANTTFADGSKIALGGYCPVAYLGFQKALFGNTEFSSERDGKTYLFVSADAKKMFDKEPEKYISSIKFDAWCATGIALGKKLATDPSLFSVSDGKVYLFSSKEAKEAFDKDMKGMMAKAEKNWKNLR